MSGFWFHELHFRAFEPPANKTTLADVSSHLIVDVEELGVIPLGGDFGYLCLEII